MRKILGFLFIVFVAIVFWAWVAQKVRGEFNDQQTVVVSLCEKVVPKLNQRYQRLDPLLEMFDKHAGWEKGIDGKVNYTGNPNNLNTSLESTMSSLDSDVINATDLCPELAKSQPMREAVNAFKTAPTPVQRIRAAQLIEDNLKMFLAAGLDIDEIRTSQTLEQFKADLTGTDAEVVTDLSAAITSVENYNTAVRNSTIAKTLQIAPL